jgi:hypothetical protein
MPDNPQNRLAEIRRRIAKLDAEERALANPRAVRVPRMVPERDIDAIADERMRLDNERVWLERDRAGPAVTDEESTP